LHLPGVGGRPAADDRSRADGVPRRQGDALGAVDRRARARAGATVGADRLRRHAPLPDRVLARVRRRPAAPPAGHRPHAAPLMSLLEARGLTKRFGGVAAVSDCSFAVPEGTITPPLGPTAPA